MQTILVIISVGASLFYLGRQLYIRFFSQKEKCESCAVSKISKGN